MLLILFGVLKHLWEHHRTKNGGFSSIQNVADAEAQKPDDLVEKIHFRSCLIKHLLNLFCESLLNPWYQKSPKSLQKKSYTKKSTRYLVGDDWNNGILRLSMAREGNFIRTERGRFLYRQPVMVSEPWDPGTLGSEAVDAGFGVGKQGVVT